MNTADHYDQEADSFGEQARIGEETEARLATNPAVQAWLKEFYGDGSGLLSHYAEKQASYLVHGPGWLAVEKCQAPRPLTEANERLWEIQQKKLFNLQCEWQAGLPDLPDERGATPSPALPAKARPPELPAGRPEPAPRHLNANDLKLSEVLIKRFGNREMLGFMRTLEFQPDQDAKTEATYAVYQELCEARVPGPVAAGHDWRECLRLAQIAHERHSVAGALPAVYRDHYLREQTGIAHPPPG